MTPEQRAKLPKWAQEHIQDLERKLLQKDALIADYRKENPISSVWYRDAERSGNIYLPEGARVRFGDSLTKNEDYVQAHYVEWHGAMALRISCDLGRIAIMPSAENCVYVTGR